jgi:hypothetical protein
VTDDHLVAARRRFLERLREEEVWRDGAGRELGRFVRAARIDPEAGTASVRHLDGNDEDLVEIRIGLRELDAAWDRLAAWGAVALELGDAEEDALGYLHVLLEEAVDGAFDEEHELVLGPDGVFVPPPRA